MSDKINKALTNEQSELVATPSPSDSERGNVAAIGMRKLQAAIEAWEDRFLDVTDEYSFHAGFRAGWKARVQHPRSSLSPVEGELPPLELKDADSEIAERWLEAGDVAGYAWRRMAWTQKRAVVCRERQLREAIRQRDEASAKVEGAKLAAMSAMESGVEWQTRAEKAEKERDKANDARKHTQEWYARYYGKLHDWARKRLPEEWRHEYFCCVANGLWSATEDRGVTYMAKAGFKVTPSNYFDVSGAAGQLILEQTERAEAAEAELSTLRAQQVDGRKSFDPAKLDELLRDVKGGLQDAYLAIREDIPDSTDELHSIESSIVAADELCSILSTRTEAKEGV